MRPPHDWNNPIYQDVRNRVDFLKLNWTTPTPVSTDTGPTQRWWEFWKWNWSARKNPEVITRYLLESLEDLIQILKKYEDFSNESRQIVIQAWAELYDAVVILPLLLKPFYGVIRRLIVDIIIPIMIELNIRPLYM